jgi:hypothetical protein
MRITAEVIQDGPWKSVHQDVNILPAGSKPNGKSRI